MRSHLCVLATLLFAVPGGAQQPPPKPAFTFEEVMIPVRDGAHLQTVILTPTAQQNAWDPAAGPTPGQYARSLNGYELPMAMEVRRGRYNTSYEHPRPLAPNTVVDWKIPLRDRDHLFLKGHRLMVQVQSTWFPLIDRNPQKFVPSIYRATAADFVKATQRVYCTPSMPSHIVLPVVP
jgi:predicted acyl esterase